MSTELQSNANNLFLTRFFGGTERGTCVQVTDGNSHQFIALTKEQAELLAQDLMDFVNNKSVELE